MHAISSSKVQYVGEDSDPRERPLALLHISAWAFIRGHKCQNLMHCTKYLFVAVFLGYNQYWPGEFMVLCPGAPEGSTGSDSKASPKTGPWLKVLPDRLGEAGNRTCDPWFTWHRRITYTTDQIRNIILK